MLKALRFALVVVAIFSSVLFATPASAGMIPTPKPAADTAQREAAKELLKCRLSEAGTLPAGLDDKMEQLSTQDLLLLAGHMESTRNAGSVGIVIAIAACVAVVVLLIIFETFYPEK